jgi:hypothetical protein
MSQKLPFQLTKAKSSKFEFFQTLALLAGFFVPVWVTLAVFFIVPWNLQIFFTPLSASLSLLVIVIVYDRIREASAKYAGGSARFERSETFARKIQVSEFLRRTEEPMILIQPEHPWLSESEDKSRKRVPIFSTKGLLIQDRKELMHQINVALAAFSRASHLKEDKLLKEYADKLRPLIAMRKRLMEGKTIVRRAK